MHRQHLRSPDDEVRVVHRPSKRWKTSSAGRLRGLSEEVPAEPGPHPAGCGGAPVSRSGAALRLPAAHDKERLQGRLARHFAGGRKGRGADQRASDRAWGSTRRSRRSNCCDPDSSSRYRSTHRAAPGEGQRDGARHPQALHRPFRRRPGLLQADEREARDADRQAWRGLESAGGALRRTARRNQGRAREPIAEQSPEVAYSATIFST